jgi:hypothetical protein
MSWDRRPPRAPALPPPEHGIRVRNIGETWWGERWVHALARFSRNYAARLRRGITYARQGRVHDLGVANGVVTARVTGSRPRPYDVTLSLKPLPDPTWQRAIGAMAGKARFTAQLLAGEMPREIDQAFAAARASLFPARADDLRARCSCPDSANPCKHIAAVHYVLGEAFDRDPFLLFELRGRSKDAVLQTLRGFRAGPAGPLPSSRRHRRGRRRGGREMERLTPPAGVAPPAGGRAGAGRDGPNGRELRGVTPETYDVLRQPLRDLRFRIAAPAVEGAILRQLGPPPGWSFPFALADILQPVVSRAAARARELALEGRLDTAGTGSSPEPAPDRSEERPDAVPGPRPARRARRH